MIPKLTQAGIGLTAVTDNGKELADSGAEDIFDITIIGAGPVGLYGAFYAGLRGARTKVIEALPQVGGALGALYPEKNIYDIAGFPEVRAKDYVQKAYQQAAFYPTEFVLGQRVRDMVRRDDGVFVLQTKKGAHYSRTVIIACGMGAFMPRRLEAPSAREFEGRGVSYSVTDYERYRDCRVLIVGGGDSALDYALELEPIAKQVDLTHRSARFSAHEETVERVKKSSVNLHYPHWVVKEITGDSQLDSVTIVQKLTGEEKSLSIDKVLVKIGYLANLGSIKDWGLEIKRGSIVVDDLMRTNIEGFYAAGDVTSHAGKINLITTGCGEIAVAVNHARTYLSPEEKMEPGHSSHMDR